MKTRSKGTWRLFTFRGTAVGVHWSFLLLVLYFVVNELLKGTPFDRIVLLGLFIIAVFGTVLLHELGHVFAARRFGCKTRDIILLPIGGVARMERLPEKPSQEIVVAIAGPLVNLFLAGLTFLVFLHGKPMGMSTLGSSIDSSNWMTHFFYSNVYLALFNLLPAFPMDGGRILRGVLSLRFGRIRATWWSARVGQIFALIMFLLGLFGNPVLCFIAVFVFLGAQIEAQSTDQQRMLKGVSAGQVAMRGLSTIQSGSILRIVSDKLLQSDASKFIVMEAERPIGYLDRQDLIKAIEKYGQDVFVESVMKRDFRTVLSDTSAESMLQDLQGEGHPLAIVRDEMGRLEGFVDLDNILEYILIRQAKERRKNRHNGQQPDAVGQTA